MIAGKDRDQRAPHRRLAPLPGGEPLGDILQPAECTGRFGQNRLTRLRRLYGRVRPDQMELNILRGVLTATQNYVYHSNNKIADLERELEELKAASKPVS